MWMVTINSFLVLIDLLLANPRELTEIFGRLDVLIDEFDKVLGLSERKL